MEKSVNWQGDPMGTSEDILGKAESWESRIGKRGGGMNLLKLNEGEQQNKTVKCGKRLGAGE